MSERTGLEIAVLGVACRFPKARTPEELWQRLHAGEDCIHRFTNQELLDAGVDPALFSRAEFVKAFGVLDDPELFDAAFFDITPRDAELVDPQHRVLLECSAEALERSGYDAASVRGAPIGIFAGCNTNSYFMMNVLPALQQNAESYFTPGFGHDKDHLATLVAYKLGLEGPCATVQSACSTALLATHLACQALLNGECDLCLAGASSITLPQTGYLGQGAGFVSADGFNRAFDHRADGTVPANGAGVVVLKRLEDALADRDPVLAVIKGSAVNNDGARRSGYSAPRLDGQAKVIRAAQLMAEVDAETVQYVEAHGSGTALGDPVEVAALTKAFRAGTERVGFCALGSIKSNFGHAGTAAGAAGLIKTVLALHHRKIPPSLHFEAPNPEINFTTSPFFVATRLEEWPTGDGPRRAGVTSLGMGGTNVHLVLEQAPELEPTAPGRPLQLVVWSAKTPTALDTMSARLEAHLAKRPEDNLADVAHTLALGRRRFDHRRMVVARNQLRGLALKENENPARARSVAFLLPGLGDQHVGMGRTLYKAEPAFRDELDRCSQILQPLLKMDIRRVLFSQPENNPRRWLERRPNENLGPLASTLMAQPVLFAVEYALARMWMSWGIRPRALLGYSLGEYVAACLAGVLTLEDALELVVRRARMIEALPLGAMTAVPLSAEALTRRLGPSLSLAAVNGREICVVAGSGAAIEAFERELAAEGLVSRRLATRHPFHSRLMEPIAEALINHLRQIELRPPKIPYLSNVTGDWIQDTEATDAEYWLRHLTQPVLFSAALDKLLSDPDTALLEVGPGQALSSLAHGDKGTDARVVTASLGHDLDQPDDLEVVLSSLGRLWLADIEPDWPAFYAGQKRRRLTLPTYPFESRRHWIDAPGSSSSAATPAETSNGLERRNRVERRRQVDRRSWVDRRRRVDRRGQAARRIVELWREVLGREEVDIDDNFFELGGHSLAGLRIIARLNRDFDADLTLRSLFESPTAASLAEHLRSARRPSHPALKPSQRNAASQERLLFAQERLSFAQERLSFAQERLWFLDQLAPGNSAYNIPSPVRLSGELDIPALLATFAEIVRRHDSLRTRFQQTAEEPLQVIEPYSQPHLPSIDLTLLPDEPRLRETARLIAGEARRPFDLERGPLVRLVLVHVDKGQYLGLLNLHHIISDGWSLSVFVRELAALYDAGRRRHSSPLPELPIQYADYANWQRRTFEAGGFQDEMDYWRQALDGVTALQLPTDRPRPAVRGFAGASAPFALPPELSSQLDSLGRGHGATLYMTLLTAFQILLHRLSGARDLAVGTPVAGRQPETESLIGFFVNTLVLRTRLKPGDDPSFNDLLSRVTDTALEAFAHQDLPFEKLVEELQPHRDLGRTPLFDVMFALQNVPAEMLEVEGLRLENLSYENLAAKFDLTLSVWQTEHGLTGHAEYSRDLFDTVTVRRLLRSLAILLQSAVDDPTRRLSHLPCLDAAQCHQLLSEWNDTAVNLNTTNLETTETLDRLIELQARLTPEAIALALGEDVLSYAELDLRTGRRAQSLRINGIGPEIRVAVSLERSFELVIELVAILKAGGAYVPIDLSYPVERRTFMLEDSTARTPLNVSNEKSGDTPSRLADSAAYMIYTSGSTGRPKGVINTHRGIVNRLLWMQRTFQIGPGDSVLQKTPMSFDVSVWEFFWPLITGARLVLARPGGHRDAAYLVQLVQRQRITTLHFVPSMLRLFIEEPDAPNLTSIRRVIASGEALAPDLSQRFAQRLAPAGAELHNLYGPTEAAVDVTWWTSDSSQSRVPIGRPVANTAVHLLDPVLYLAPIGVAAQLAIAGIQLARGYHGRPARSAESFIPNPLGKTAGERLYLTGDLARSLKTGEIEFLGRLDHQVKVRGFRIELGEIETVLLTHPAIQAAVALPSPDHQSLRAWVVRRDSGGLASHLKDYAQRKLPEHLVPEVIFELDDLPLLPNGKVDRKALVNSLPQLDADAGVHSPTTPPHRPNRPSEDLLVEIWGDLLDVPRVDTQANFFELGGHSLLATRLVSRVRDVFGIELELQTVFDSPTLAGLATRIEAAASQNTPTLPAIARAPRDQPLPLSFAQQRLWLLDRLVPDNPFYNMATAVRVSGPIDGKALNQAFQALVARHESLRTTFQVQAEEPRQIIAPSLDIALPLIDLEALPEPLRRAELSRRATEERRRPFDLSLGPLIRLRWVRLGRAEHALLLTLHHIISDGWSMGVLYREVASLYEGAPLPELPIQYADFAVWQRQWFQGEVEQAQLNYWTRQLDGLPESLDLPFDRPRPTVSTFRGRTESLRLEPELRRGLSCLTRNASATLAMTLLTGFKVLLAAHTAQVDIAVGVAIAGRRRPELENVLGFFVNTLVLRTRLKNVGFRHILRQVRDISLAAYSHQDLPFERLVEELDPKRDLSRNPLVQVMFGYQNFPHRLFDVRGLSFELPPEAAADIGTSKFDLTLFLFEEDETLRADLEFNSDLFDPCTVRRLGRHFTTLLAAAVARPDTRVAQLQWLSPGEHHQLLLEWNPPPLDWPAEASLQELFEARVQAAPNALAVLFGQARWSYAELNRRANRLAHRLRQQGIHLESLVGLSLERSAGMVVAVLGIIKAGAAYLPLDPDYPQERLDFMRADAGLDVVITGNDWDVARKDVSEEEEHNPATVTDGSNLAYVIYTSGSTGRPKGVGVTHRGISRLMLKANYLQLKPSDRVAQLANISFDAATFELWGALLNGAALVGLEKEEGLDPIRLEQRIDQLGITTLFMTTGLFNQVARQRPAAFRRLRHLLFGGEAADSRWVGAARKSFSGTLINAYGPTECTTFATCYSIPVLANTASPLANTAMNDIVPIGRPIHHTRLYVLDRLLMPVPIAVPGELVLGGDGLARVYLGRPATTAQSFVPDPFTDSGERLYRTGDRVRTRSDGLVEYLGRLDNQVKLRGHRIELAEIEAVLLQHPAVAQNAVLLGTDQMSAALTAYVVQDQDWRKSKTRPGSTVSETASEKVDDWGTIFDDIYSRDAAAKGDPTFNTVGWNSTYTGLPLPASEMREWLDDTIDRVESLQPDRVLEIGCGTGMLLFRLAPRCTAYWATDVSRRAVSDLEEQVQHEIQGCDIKGCDIKDCEVRLFHQAADRLENLSDGEFDTIILNSVVQYFPSMDYLAQVLKNAARLLQPGGALFIGDVRSLPLLETFHRDVEFFHAEPDLDPKILERRTAERLARENELVVDPEFFAALAEHVPEIQQVEIHAKRGQAKNELTTYRYQVILRVGEASNERLNTPEPPPEPETWGAYGNDPLQGQFARRIAPELRDFLSHRLPAIMVPSSFVLVDTIPLSPIGKVDRKALSQFGCGGRRATDDFTPPRNDLEKTLADIWSEVLSVSRVGIHDEFFDLGGHSLLATRVVSRIRDSLALELPLQRLFESSTVAELAEYIESQAEQELSREAATFHAPPIRPLPRNSGGHLREDVPLSFAQQRLWILDQLEGKSTGYAEGAAVRLLGHLNVNALHQSLDEIVRRHEILRTAFPTVHGQAVQRITHSDGFELNQVDLSALPRNERERISQKLALQACSRPFRLATGPPCRGLLLRQTANDHVRGHQVLVFAFHHIVFDGWSVSVFLKELSRCYAAFATGAPSPLEPLPLQYADFAVWQRKWLEDRLMRDGLEHQLDWWRQHLRDAAALELPTDRPRRNTAEPRGGVLTWQLKRQRLEPLCLLARQHGATPYMALLAVLQTLLCRLSGGLDVTVGTPVANRNRLEIEGLIGFFINMLALRTNFADLSTRHFEALLDQLRQTVSEALTRQDLPFEKLVEEMRPERRLDRSPLFQVSFQWLDLPSGGLELPGVETEPFTLGRATVKFDLSLLLSEIEGQARGRVEYRADLFDRSTVQRWLEHFEVLVDEVVRQPDRHLDELPWLSDGQQQQILREWNDSQVTFDDAFFVHREIERRAALQGDRIAVTTDEARLSYGEFFHRVDRWATRLRARGVGAEVTVGVALERSFDSVIAFLAVLKAGGVYLPIDPSLPRERIEFMIRDSRASLILRQFEQAEQAEAGASSTLLLPPGHIYPDQSAYVLYTSGSTGQPKGSVISHRALANYLQAFPLDASDVLLQKTPASFDVSVGETLAPLLAGGQLVLARPGGHRDPAYLADQILRHRVTVLHGVPTLLRLLAKQPDARLPRRIFAGGEVLTTELADRLRSSPGFQAGQLVNGYGPTETAIRATWHRVASNHLDSKPLGRSTTPIGRPIANFRTLVVNPALHPVPLGVHGELCLAGVGLGRGYLYRPSLTAQCFIPHPLAAVPGERLYRAGDLVRRLGDGQLEFLHRLDHQVKVRGFRIELGDIENALIRHPTLVEAAVLVSEKPEPRLIAFIVPTSEGSSSETTPAVHQLRDFLRDILPDYMIPASFIVVKDLPLLPSGKVDRGALAQTSNDLPSEARQHNQRPPRDSTELAMVRLWEEVLNVEPVGLGDDFFALGGHSVQAVHLMSQIEQLFGRRLPLSLLFQRPTPEHLAAALHGVGKHSMSGSLVPLRASGSKPPLFLVHPIGGQVLCYRELTLALGPDQPIYGLRAHGLESGESPALSIEEMAAGYVDEIFSLQAGPSNDFSGWSLGGWSMGGTIAFEMTRLLMERGAEVNALLLIDSRASGAGQQLTEDSLTEDRPAFWIAFAQELGLPWNEVGLTIDDFLVLRPDKRIEMALRSAQSVGVLPSSVGVDEIRRHLRVFQAHARASHRYRPKPLTAAVPTVLFQASEGLEASSRESHWASLTHDLVRHEVPGHHHSILSADGALCLAAHIGAMEAKP